ncbi:hypothetical protein ACS0TY_010356 [Phlomoides rotata]
MLEGIPVNLISKKKGIPKKKCLQLDVDMMKSIAFEKISTIRRLAKELGMSKSHVGILVKAGVTRSHTNAIKHELTTKNKLQRIKFSLNVLSLDMATNKIIFSGMYHVVHTDKKWFYMSKACEILHGSRGRRTTQVMQAKKKIIPKIMFKGAVAMPQQATDGQQTFDGKLGIFPFTIKELAKRNSKKRAKGTIIQN